MSMIQVSDLTFYYDGSYDNVFEHVSFQIDTDWKLGLIVEEMEREKQLLFKALLRKLDFSRIQFDKSMNEYSAGQKKKVLLAKSLCEKAHLYI